MLVFCINIKISVYMNGRFSSQVSSVVFEVVCFG